MKQNNFSNHTKDNQKSPAISATDSNKKSGNSILTTLMRLFIIFAILLFVLYNYVFILKDVYIIGNNKFTASEITKKANIIENVSLFSLNGNKLKKNLEKNPYLIFNKLQIDYLKLRAYITIEERVPASILISGNIYYLMDKTGMILEQINPNTSSFNLPIIIGFKGLNANIGQTIYVSDPEQLSAYLLLINALLEEGYNNQIININLSDPDNILLETIHNIDVRLNDSTYINAKVKAMKYVIVELIKTPDEWGLLDVTIPHEPKYQKY